MAFIVCASSSIVTRRKVWACGTIGRVSNEKETKSFGAFASANMSLGNGEMKRLAAAIATGALLSVSMVPSLANASVFNFRGERPANVGLRGGDRYLDNCPASTSNCISSMANVNDSHYVPGWSYVGSGKDISQARDDLMQVLDNFPGTETVTVVSDRKTKSEVGSGHYIYAEFQSKFWGFVDDVEFFFQPDGKTVEYRSASRLGENDLDANRKRIRAIRVALQDIGGWQSIGYY